MNRKFKIALLIVLFLGLCELVLRFAFGFCDAVLMQADQDLEYLAQPGQSRYRFGNHIYYNSLSMRSPEIDPSATVVLGFGDSILNGGTPTDQSELATTIVSGQLSDLYQKKVQFLNISAGSWGPDNAYAYLQKYGDFNANGIYLIISSHDAYDTMDFDPVVGIDRNYPNSQYTFALVELMDRYLLPRIFKKGDSEQDHREKSLFNPGFTAFEQYARTHNIALVLILHAERSELLKGEYNQMGQEIIRFANQRGIPIIKDLESGLDDSHYRDNLHLNAEGQELLARLIFESERAKVNKS